jgi:hypothetical protein
MTAPLTHRCWTHDSREAVCRCPECGRSFCRECVTEHQSRLLCAACLARLVRLASMKPHRRPRIVLALMLAGGILVLTMLFFGAAQGILAITGRG